MSDHNVTFARHLQNLVGKSPGIVTVISSSEVSLCHIGNLFKSSVLFNLSLTIIGSWFGCIH